MVPGQQNSHKGCVGHQRHTIKTINLNLTSNQGPANRCKIYLHWLSGLLNFITKNHLQCTSYTSPNPQFASFVYTYKITGRTHVCGIIKFKQMTDSVQLQLVVYHAMNDQEFKALIIAGYGYNVHSFLSKLQEKRNTINFSPHTESSSLATKSTQHHHVWQAQEVHL
jgi:hypothetical protein